MLVIYYQVGHGNTIIGSDREESVDYIDKYLFRVEREANEIAFDIDVGQCHVMRSMVSIFF